eukprot:gene10173-11911_t
MQAGNFMPIILYMSISDLGLNFVSAFGYPADGSALCWIQGLLATYFTIASWFWTTMLAFRVYSMIRYGSCKLTLVNMHLIAWGVPALLTLLPLTTTDYGRGDGSLEWCLFTARKGFPLWVMDFWSYITFFIWLFICFGLMIAWQLIIQCKFQQSALQPVISRTYGKVYLYPVAMIFCWVLNLICDHSIGGKKSHNLAALGMLFGISNGILAAFIFMFKSEEAQRRWYTYLFPDKQSEFETNVEPPIRLDFEDDDNEELMTEYSQRMTEYTNRSTNVSMVGKLSEITREYSFATGTNSIISSNVASVGPSGITLNPIRAAPSTEQL